MFVNFARNMGRVLDQCHQSKMAKHQQYHQKSLKMFPQIQNSHVKCLGAMVRSEMRITPNALSVPTSQSKLIYITDCLLLAVNTLIIHRPQYILAKSVNFQ